MKFSAFLTVTSILFCSAPAWAQSTAQTNETSCESQKSKLQDEVNRYQKQLRDWPNLGRYRDEDARMTPTKAGVDRVVFMGDSITDFWGRQRGTFFPGKPYVNRGISGQTTPQMLIRFRPDVINLQPKVVVILAGTNDIAGNTGPESLTDIENNLASMAELAKANKIRVVLATVMPVCDYIKPQTGRRPPAQIQALNTWIRQYAGQNGLTLLDYYSAMVDDHGMLKKDLTFDGLHPNAEGYAVMGPLAEKAISDAESRRQQ
ncbi:MAG TPA: SGNH/GDSL hydrolase family protein [Bryobacteraceae bacterium]|nr:SGNH/GDSL hydrolase family protein [Bryobacteraceae bacterium]